MSAAQSRWYDLPEIDWETLFHPSFDYRYFRQPLVLPLAAEDICPSDVCTPLTAAWAADAAMLAYGGIGTNRMDLLDFDELLDSVQMRGHRIGNWSPDAKSVKAFFAYNQRFAMLAFRGTKRINWINSTVDLAAFLAHEHPETDPDRAEFTADQAGHSEVAPGSDKVLVHAGFQFALNTLWEDISFCLGSYRKKYPFCPILFTGHSLGAAFATMSAARFRGGKAALYTYGSPRVGNAAFCKQVHRNADLGVFRFVNNRDLMTSVPPRDKSYEHTCGLMQIGPEGTIVPACETEDRPSAGMAQVLHNAAAVLRDYMSKEPPPPDLVDHAQRRYCYYIWRWARSGQVP